MTKIQTFKSLTPRQKDACIRNTLRVFAIQPGTEEHHIMARKIDRKGVKVERIGNSIDMIYPVDMASLER